jgi:hypothetical protein
MKRKRFPRLHIRRIFHKPLGEFVKREYAGSVLFDFVVSTAQVDLEKMRNVCSLCVIRDLFAELAIVGFTLHCKPGLLIF